MVYLPSVAFATALPGTQHPRWIGVTSSTLVTPHPGRSVTGSLLVALDGPLIQKPDVINVKPTSSGNARERRASLSAATVRLTRPSGARPAMAMNGTRNR